MEKPPAAPLPASSESLRTRLVWLFLLLATLYVCYFSHLGAIGFLGPDEPRYAWIARAMAETGDWVTPRLYDKPWFEKPPLYYWGAAVSFKLFGVSEATARLPSAVSALLATLALAWLALRLYGAETARWLLLLLPTTAGMIGFSHAAAPDMPFSAMLTIALVAAAYILRLIPDTNSSDAAIDGKAPESSASLFLTSFTSSLLFASAVFGFFLGLAVLAKGPAGVILCGGAVLFWVLLTRRWRDALRVLHPAGIATFCLTALPWYILCARRNPDFFRIFIIEHNFKRFLTQEFQHVQPFWYYGPVLLVATFPWTALFIGLSGYLRSSRKLDRLRSAHLFFLTWPIFTFLFFSVSKSKLPGYLLPAIPPLTVLFAETLRHVRQWEQKVTRFRATGFGLGLSSMALLGGAAVLIGRVLQNGGILTPHLSSNARTKLVELLVIYAVAAFVAGSPIIILWYKRQEKAAMLLMQVLFLVVLVLCFANTGVIEDVASVRPAFEEANGKWPPLSRGNVRTYKLRRNFQYSLNFYLHGEARELSPTDDRDVVIFTDFAGEVDLKGLGFPCTSRAITESLVVCKSSP